MGDRSAVYQRERRTHRADEGAGGMLLAGTDAEWDHSATMQREGEKSNHVVCAQQEKHTTGKNPVVDFIHKI